MVAGGRSFAGQARCRANTRQDAAETARRRHLRSRAITGRSRWRRPPSAARRTPVIGSALNREACGRALASLLLHGVERTLARRGSFRQATRTPGASLICRAHAGAVLHHATQARRRGCARPAAVEGGPRMAAVAIIAQTWSSICALRQTRVVATSSPPENSNIASTTHRTPRGVPRTH